MGLGSCEEADTLLSTGRQAGKLPGVEIRLAALRPHHVAAASPPPPPSLGCVPEPTAPPAGMFPQKLPVGSPLPHIPPL